MYLVDRSGFIQFPLLTDSLRLLQIPVSKPLKVNIDFLNTKLLIYLRSYFICTLKIFHTSFYDV